MITEIGIIAGEIWHFLEPRGETTLSNLAGELKQPEDLTLMSVGWLAREGHVIIKQEAGEFKIWLRQDNQN